MPLPWCTRCGTSLSQHEMLGSYVETEDLSLYVTANLLDGSGRALVLWTTTPWTLPANVAAAVHPTLTYEEVDWEGRRLVLSAARARAPRTRRRAAVRRELRGAELVGLEFETFFPDLPVQGRHRARRDPVGGDRRGRGIGHRPHRARLRARGLRAEPRSSGSAVIAPLDSSGDYVDGFDWLEGRNAATVADDVAAHLRDAGRIVKDELYAHSVPGVLALQEPRAVPARRRVVHQRRRSARADARGRGHRDVGTAAHRQPDGRLARTTWATGASRASATGACRSPSTAARSATSSRSSARAPSCASVRSTRKLVDELPELHRPWIDDIKISCASCDAPAARVPEVGDCWLDAGIVAVLDARLLRRSRRLEGALPRRVDQRDARAGPPLVLLDALHERRARRRVRRTSACCRYERVISETGEKFSKTGHMIRFDDAVAEIGADPIRYLFCRQPPGDRVPVRVRGGRAGAAPARRAVEHRVVLRHVREHRPGRDGRADDARRRAARHRPLAAGAHRAARRRRDGGDGAARTRRRRCARSSSSSKRCRTGTCA